VVELTQAAGAHGRFGLAVYTLWLPDGVDVVLSPMTPPYTVHSHTDRGHGDEVVLDGSVGAVDALALRRDRPCMVEAHTDHAGQTRTAATNPVTDSGRVPSQPRLTPTAVHHEPAVVSTRRRRSARLEQGVLDLEGDAR
jgi:hypothetical protein